jgi:hypothetical protein
MKFSVFLSIALVVLLLGCTDALLEKCEKSSVPEKDLCYAELAKARRDFTLCEKVMVGGRDSCYLSLALIDWSDYENAVPPQDTIACEKIQKQETRDYCLAIMGKDASKCEKISFQSPENEALLKSLCYQYIGIATLDLSTCDKASANNGILKEACYARVAVYKKDPAICDNLKLSFVDGGVYIKNACYTGVANATREPGICSKINESNLLENCLNAAR